VAQAQQKQLLKPRTGGCIVSPSGVGTAPCLLRFNEFCGAAVHHPCAEIAMADGRKADFPIQAALRIFRVGRSRFACFT
jgi:hypothetical protein